MQSVQPYKIAQINQATRNAGQNMSTSMASKAKKQTESEQNTPEAAEASAGRSPADHQNADEAW